MTKGEELIDIYQPVKIIKTTLSKLPIKYETKNGRILSNDEYS